MYRLIAVAIATLATGSVAHAQLFDALANPDVIVKIDHPPGLGVKINKVAFGPASGKCADEIVDSLISMLVSSQVEVLDREHLAAIAAEKNLASSGQVDRQNAIALGKLIGPSVLIFVKTSRCDTVQDRLHDTEKRYNDKAKAYYAVNAYYSRTRAYLKASIQTVDLGTGRIFAARTLEFAPEQQYKSYEGYPEPPPAPEVLGSALQSVVTEVHRMLMPWSEQTKLVYYNDKACGLKQAFELMRSGAVDRAFEQSKANLETCEATPDVKNSVLGHAYYNVGIGHMIRNEHDQALQNFQQAATLRPGDIVAKAIADCERARQLTAELRRFEERIALEPAQDPATTAQAAASSALTNADVIMMVKSKLSDPLVIQKIQSSTCNFDTSPAGLSSLAKAGVSEPVVMEIMKR
jgi:tetratricopeptide (TPR) repeat protein